MQIAECFHLLAPSESLHHFVDTESRLRGFYLQVLGAYHGCFGLRAQNLAWKGSSDVLDLALQQTCGETSDGEKSKLFLTCILVTFFWGGVGR